MATRVEKHIGTGKEFTFINTFDNWLSSQNLVTQDIWIDAIVHNDQASADTTVTAMHPNTYDETHYCVVRPVDGKGVNELNASGPLDYGTVGIELKVQANAVPRIAVGNGVYLEGFRIDVLDSAAPATSNQYAIDVARLNAYGPHAGSLRKNRIRSAVTNVNNAAIRLGANNSTGDASDNVFFQETGGAPFIQMVNSCPAERNTYIRRGTSTGSAIRMSNGLQSPQVNDSVFFNCGDTPVIHSGTPAGAFNHNYTNIPLAVAHAGFIHSTNLIESVNDARPTSNSALIEAGSARARSTRDMRNRNRGQRPDAGAVQLKDVIDLPTGNVTSIVRDGQKITITGTTTGTPGAGQAVLTPVNVPHNSAVGQGPIDVILGVNSFSVVFENLQVGLYALSIILENAGGPGNVVNNQGNINIVYATGAITTWSLIGQELTIEGTTAGNPISATCTIPVATNNPGSAVQYGPVPVTLESGTFKHSAALTPGSYGVPIIVFNTAEGTSFPASGGSAVSIIGISGNPGAPAPAPTIDIDSAILVDGQVLVEGTVNVREDTASVLEITYIPEEGEPESQGTIDYDPVTGIWEYNGEPINGHFKVRAIITATDGQSDTVESESLFEEVIIISSGIMLLPLK